MNWIKAKKEKANDLVNNKINWKAYQCGLLNMKV